MEVVEKDKDIVRTMSVRIGKRTYYYDVKTASNGDYFLVITESVRNKMGMFDRHKLFVYKEDFYKFSKALEEVLTYMKCEKPDYFDAPAETELEDK